MLEDVYSRLTPPKNEDDNHDDKKEEDDCGDDVDDLDLFVQPRNSHRYYKSDDLENHQSDNCLQCRLYMFVVIFLTKFWNPPSVLFNQGPHRYFKGVWMYIVEILRKII